MMDNTNHFGSVVSVIMAVMIHMGVAAWAASGLSPGDRTSSMGKSRAVSMDVNLAIMASPAKPEPVTEKTEVVPEIPRVTSRVKTVKKSKTACYTEPEKKIEAEPAKIPENPEETILAKVEAPVPETPCPHTNLKQTIEKNVSEDIAPSIPVFPPGLTSPIRPHYPRTSRLRREEGDVTVWFHVRENGHAEDIRVVKSSGYTRLDKAAANAVRTHTFIPAEKDHRPEDSLCAVTIRFQIRS